MGLRWITLLRGIASSLPVIGERMINLRSGGSSSTRYCYSVWLRHWLRLREVDEKKPVQAIAEIGPGDSLGTGICALLLGASKYLAIDVQSAANQDMNRRILKEMVEILQRCERIPDEREFPRLYPALSNYDYPKRLVQTADIRKIEKRIELALREMNSVNKSNKMIGYYTINEVAAIGRGSIDFLFSQAVMCYPDDLEKMYAYCWEIMKPGGIMAHTIPCDCVGTTKHWNGHYSVKKWQWRLAKGKRPCFISRTPGSRHLQLISKAGFEILRAEKRFRSDGINRPQLAAEYAWLSDEDLQTCGVYVMARRKT
jgi:SAM-dependent methyltransferase